MTKPSDKPATPKPPATVRRVANAILSALENLPSREEQDRALEIVRLSRG